MGASRMRVKANDSPPEFLDLALREWPHDAIFAYLAGSVSRAQSRHFRCLAAARITALRVVGSRVQHGANASPLQSRSRASDTGVPRDHPHHLLPHGIIREVRAASLEQ